MMWNRLVLLLFVFAIGCGGRTYDIVQVSGTVTIDGKPLTNATILTQPVGSQENLRPGPGSFCRLDDEGHFQLEFQHEDEPGAVPGEVWVKLMKNGKELAADDDSAQMIRSKIPYEYREGKAKHTIPAEGSDAWDIALETRRRRK